MKKRVLAIVFLGLIITSMHLVLAICSVNGYVMDSNGERANLTNFNQVLTVEARCMENNGSCSIKTNNITGSYGCALSKMGLDACSACGIINVSAFSSDGSLLGGHLLENPPAGMSIFVNITLDKFVNTYAPPVSTGNSGRPAGLKINTEPPVQESSEENVLETEKPIQAPSDEGITEQNVLIDVGVIVILIIILFFPLIRKKYHWKFGINRK